jgi:RNA polymerase sigma-70 factor (ECF subfamily)
VATDTGFEEIYEQLFPLIYRFVIIRVPASAAEDLTAEIMVKLWRSLADLKEKSALRSWALRIAYNQIVDYYRSEKHIPVFCGNKQPDPAKMTQDHTEQAVLLSSIKDTLSRLPASQVTVIQLRIVEGFSAAEVAAILGTSKQAVDSLLYRAKKGFCKIYSARNMGGKRL